MPKHTLERGETSGPRIVGSGLRLLVGALGLCLWLPLHAQQEAASAGLHYDSQPQGPVPIPPSERNLQTAIAQPWFKVSDQPMVLEGPCFDRAGNLVFSDVYGGRVLRVTPDKHLSMVFRKEGLGPGRSGHPQGWTHLYRRHSRPTRVWLNRGHKP
jgi:hypothetical protein